MKTNPHRPSAHGVRPLFRLQLVGSESTLGFPLLDVIAIIPGERERDSQHTFPTYICLGLSTSNEWTPVEVHGFEGSEDIDANYKVVDSRRRRK
jgi:hypothetical protein